MLKPGTLPSLTHERYLILSTLVEHGGRMTAENLREKLAARGWTPSQPGFVQIMSRAEDAKYVNGEYGSKLVDGMPKRIRIYGITRKGLDACGESLKFYTP